MRTESIALIYNPRSHSVTRKGSVLTKAAAHLPGARLLRIDDFDALPDAITTLAQAGVERIAIEGGDGTVLAVLSAALDPKTGFRSPPEFAILPGGSTNLAYDLMGFQSATSADLAHRLQSPTSKRHEQRALHVELANAPRPHVGFLLSTGALARAMRYVQREFHGDGRRGLTAVAAAILRFVISPYKYTDSDDHPILRPTDYHLQGDHVTLDGVHTMSIATSLPKLSLGLKPFWGTEPGDIALTHVAWPTHGLRRTLVRVLLGMTSKSMAKHGFTSYRSSQFTITHHDTLMLDGEILPIPQDGRIAISTTQPLVFLR